MTDEMTTEWPDALEQTRDPQGRVDALVSERCAHIGEPMTIGQLAEYIGSNDYSAELALQHALILLSR